MSTALLMSGGLDSTALAYWKRPQFGITVDYGQVPSTAEVKAAQAVSSVLGIGHHIVRADLRDLGSGELAAAKPLELAPVPEWWPFRNQMLITLGAMKAISLGVKHLLIGTVRGDAVHADGRKDFVIAMAEVLRLQEGSLWLEAPTIHMSSAELIRTAGVPMEILGWAHSCHVSDYACGWCRGCRKHYETLTELGVDPY